MNISGLRGNLVVGAGTPYRISPDAGDTNTSADGTTTSVGHELHSGEHYTVSTYMPEPTVAEMRAAPAPPEGYYERYTTFELPGFAPAAPQPVTVGLRGVADRGDPNAADDAPLVALLGHVPPGPEPRRQQGDHYDVANSIENYLRSSRFTYSERPPVRRYPLESFVFQRPHRLLPAVLRRDGADAADGGIPARVVGRLRAGLAR